MKVLANNHGEMTDLELVRKCQKGDENSFRLLYQRYQHKVRATLYQLCGSELLDDLQQEVFLKTWKALPKLREAKYFSTWLYRICWNVASDHSLARKRDHHRQVAQTDLVKQKSRNHHQTDLLQLHYQELIQSALQNLNLEHRAVVVLHDLEDMPQKEVAEILSIPLGTVKSRLFTARKSLRQFLELQGVNL
ncbi:MAG: sigma-70 family RNA polymerase sigma factor [Cyanobacteria bacterium]|nr:sigma-70 family RNA polymerase sigma factor [Cyanobacteria bacterium CG_2015-16_32_12]NCO77351.1 sigma-70 family RNA polymerase sigma factor [Cyanobacteria bacterium CG_2015-22_32_23]NCQ04132.1 sigma-70 family RNA polymerase sigma factor [Cyanobacteria bacterium CG_2015-09_32_10]NCQ42549.1 sigma-70 family RNA polymerase sigma factor [Cyanobacteria bacterium CG_2015-04_32_10]NCS83887.1 sigma-70 family RNA polymerase sigma factor [Cyanobacteria bacterium CG_2015-02_32_10]